MVAREGEKGKWEQQDLFTIILDRLRIFDNPGAANTCTPTRIMTKESRTIQIDPLIHVMFASEHYAMHLLTKPARDEGDDYMRVTVANCIQAITGGGDARAASRTLFAIGMCWAVRNERAVAQLLRPDVAEKWAIYRVQHRSRLDACFDSY